MASVLEKLWKKVKTSFEKLNDKNDENMLRINNPALLLKKVDDNYKIWIVFNKKTEKWICKNLKIENCNIYNKFAVDLEGNFKAMQSEKVFEGLKYKYYGLYIEPLFAFSKKSKKKFWATEKFDSLNAYDGNDKLSFESLKALEEMINEEHLQKQNEVEQILKTFKPELVSEDNKNKSFEELVEKSKKMMTDSTVNEELLTKKVKKIEQKGKEDTVVYYDKNDEEM